MSMPRVQGRNVIVRTSYIRPPIPTKKFDWQAVLDNYEPGQPIGHGELESEAVYDLFCQIEEIEAEEESDVA